MAYNPYVTKDRVTDLVYTYPKTPTQVVTKDRVTGYSDYNATQKAQQNAAEKKTYTNIDPRITQRQNQVTTAQPTADNKGGNVDVGTGTGVATDPYAGYYNKMISMYEKQLAEEKARQDAIKQSRINAANKVYDTSIANLNDATDSSLRQAYIKHMQEQKALPQQMQAYGLSGGATETNLANMKNVYGTNRANIQAENIAQQRMIEQDRANAIMNAEADAADYEANAVREYNNGLLDVYASALNNKMSANTGSTNKDLTKSNWYKLLTNLVVDDRLTTDEAADELMRLGLDEYSVDELLSVWESTF